MLQKMKIWFLVLTTTAYLARLAGAQAANDHLATPNAEAVKVFAGVLPAGWSCRREGQTLIVHPDKPLEFVNLTNAESEHPDEAREAYLDRHRVRFDYRFVLRFAPKLTVAQVEGIVADNDHLRRESDSIARGPLRAPSKRVAFADTSDGKAAAEKYARLRERIKPVPVGAFGDFSVYLETTEIGYARFRNKQTEKECKSVEQALIKQLVPYGRRPANIAPPVK